MDEEAVIRSAAEVDYPSFSIVDENDRADGFSVELMRAALAKMGRAVTFRTGPWSEVRGWLERGEVDCLPLVGRTPEREELFDFTVPYLTMHGAIVVREDTEDIRGLSDLRGRRVAVMKGDNAEECLRREDRELEIVITPTFTDAFHALAEGRCDAVVVQRLVALRLLNKTGLSDRLRIVERPVTDFAQDFCFAVKAGDREMLALLNEGLALVVADGTQRRLHSKWFAQLELPANRPIVIGGDHNYPPFEFLDKDGRPAGYNVDLVQAVADAAGLDIHIRLGSWPEITRALKHGEIDVLQGMFYSPERNETFDFSPAHHINHYVAVVRRESGPPPTDVAGLAGKQLVVQRGDIMHEFSRKHDLTDQLTLVDAQEDALLDVAEGRSDCALVARMTAFYWIEHEGWDNLVVGRTPLLSPEYCFAVSQDHQALLAEFSEGLAAVKASGEYRRIQQKWLGVYDERTFGWRDAVKYVVWIAGPLLLVALLALLWSWGLRRQVARRTVELREQETFLRTVLDNLPVGVAVNSVEPCVNFDYMNDLFPAIYRTSREALSVPDAFWQSVYGNDRFSRELRERVLQDCASGDPARMVWTDVPIARKGEETTYITARNTPIPGTDRMISSVWDVTERKRNEARIERLNQVLRAIRDVNQLITHEKNRDALLQRSCEILISTRGYRSAWVALRDAEGRVEAAYESGIGEGFSKIRAKLDNGDWPVCCRQAWELPDGIAPIYNTNSNCSTCPLSHTYCDAAALAGVLRHEDREFGVLVVALPREVADDPEEQSLFRELVGDVAYALRAIENAQRSREEEEKRKSLESQLQQAQKMESVGRLAGGVAHDFNNLLMGIMNYAELCRENVGAEHPVREWLDEITQEAERSAKLARQLLAFARKQTVAPKILDLNEVVEGMLKMLRRLIGEDVDLVWQPGTGLWPVKLDPGQIDQILANLCVNARDAIGGVGKLTIETENATIDEKYCDSRAYFKPGEYVVLAVSDDGCGMDPETLENIFEPFYTTKGVGEGTGLGLATVYGIVKQNEGFINVYSEPGKGTTFRIYLSRCERSAEEPRETVAPTEHHGGTEIILLVEDEKSIRVTAAAFLERLGYTVLAADSPEAALQLASDHPDNIDLLITDVVMPGMSGRDLAEKLAPDHPAMKVLYISGYTANVIAHRGILDTAVTFLAKPFTRDDLAAKVREVLGSE
ncbi:MAG: transporter substrate-binding domain-containing protein [Verrucomicrobiota bacterium]